MEEIKKEKESNFETMPEPEKQVVASEPINTTPKPTDIKQRVKKRIFEIKNQNL